MANQVMAKIELKPIRDLLSHRFYIPDYQRGYRWGKQQVIDLLDDISEFIDKGTYKDGFYCLQPLVVRETIDKIGDFIERLPRDGDNALLRTRSALAEYVEWEVIDGQQRLTTIYLILLCLESDYSKSCSRYALRYARESQKFLEELGKGNGDAGTNIDSWHMQEAFDAIKDWFKAKKDNERDLFLDTLLNRVQFIWYETDEDPIKVFTRLNIGKIGLTNSELIKALFLNQSNFTGDDADKIYLRQLEIATEWDRIESALNDDEFWMFLHEPGYEKPTRIDFLFDLLVECQDLDNFIDADLSRPEKIGKDRYRTFRYFNAYFHSKKQNPVSDKTVIERCWEAVDGLFSIFSEWFCDLQLYHYVGFLIDQKVRLPKILEAWKDSGTKSQFIDGYLIPRITKSVEGCLDLNAQYEINGNHKTNCRPLLLLHNIQTVINQNAKKQKDGIAGVFYRFPFHLYKTEGWDIEHIDSNSENDLEDKKSQNEFLINRFNAVLDEGVQELIVAFVNDPLASDFANVRKHTEDALGENLKMEMEDRLDVNEKNQVWNFALLDSSTNRSYGNAIFSAKRRIIIGKDQGQYVFMPRLTTKNGQPCLDLQKPVDAPSAFIPPCTRHVFFKYYSPVVSAPNFWLKADAKAYKENILKTLKGFGVIDSKEDADEN